MMTSFGRGRGWGTTQNKEPALRRPGLSASPKEDDWKELIEKISEFSINERKQKLHDIIALINTVIKKKNFSSVVFQLYEQALNDKAIGLNLVALCLDKAFQKLCTDEVDMSTCEKKCPRRIIFSCLQHDYENKEELRKESSVIFQNYILMLGELHNLEPTKVVEVPLITCLGMLLETGTVEDIELLLIQILKHGGKLYTRNAKLLENLIMNVREVLVVRDLSAASRAMLLLIIDFVHHQCSTLPFNLHKFYRSQLSSDILQDLLVNTSKYCNIKQNKK